MPVQRHTSRQQLTYIVLLLALLFQTGCGRKYAKTIIPPEDLIAYGLRASNSPTSDADEDRPIVAGTPELYVSGTFWSEKPIIDMVVIKLQAIRAGGKLMTMDSGTAEVQAGSDQKYPYRITLRTPEQSGLYILRTLYGAKVVDEVLLELVN